MGIDEVGRGPLAGPIAVGAVAVPYEIHEWKHWEGLKDSKKLSEKKRVVWNDMVQGRDDVRSAVVMVGAKEIDAMGIAAAARRAAAEALAALSLVPTEAEVLLDHGLRVPDAWQQEAFVKGDERFPSIALASIVAKVARDTLMVAMDTRYPGYGFAAHKGYGTKAHAISIREKGLSPIHRATFCHF